MYYLYLATLWQNLPSVIRPGKISQGTHRLLKGVPPALGSSPYSRLYSTLQSSPYSTASPVP